MLNTEVNYILENDTPFVVDTNILVYANDKNADKKKYEGAKNLLSHNAISRQGFVSAQNLAEFYSTVTTKLSKILDEANAAIILRSIASTFLVITYSSSTVTEAARISSIYKTDFWDSLIAATMIENNIFTIFTENIKDFKKIQEITCINPFDLDSKEPLKKEKTEL